MRFQKKLKVNVPEGTIIEIVTDEATGEVTLEGHGFRGKACDLAMHGFEADLGVIIEKKYKDGESQHVRKSQGA